jgi:PAS domain S-box-containing protein
MKKNTSSEVVHSQSLRVLMVEDSEDDVLLIIRELKKGGYNPSYERVENAVAMKKALEEKQWDVILCDYKLSIFNAPSAIAVLKEVKIDIPIIIVSGAIGEDMAVECMHSGARDYIMKDNLSRLCPAIAREVKEMVMRNKQMHTEDKLRSEERMFRVLAEHSSDITLLLNLEGIVIYINPAVERILGFKPEERIGASGFDLVHPDDIKLLADAFNTLSRDTNSPVIQGEIHLRHKDGNWRTLEAMGSNLVNNNIVEAIIVNYRDITGRKQMEQRLQESEKYFKEITENSSDIIIITDKNGDIKYGSRSVERFTGYKPEEIFGRSAFAFIHPDDVERAMADYGKAILAVDSAIPNAFRIVHKDGSERYFEGLGKNLLDNPVVAGFIMNVRDVTERKQTEEKLLLTLDSLRKAVGTTIQVLVTALEARDPYTAGHQSRVADLARAIATEMELPQDKIEGIRMAGSIHDIGKLSIPAEILSKPTPLTNIEFSLIKEHSRIGYEMLKDVESPWPLAQIVYQHHERMNGSGYPRNLKGDEIIIEARIMAVADVVEAMASHRPYRPGLGIEAALEEIEKNKGILYDDAVVDACLKLFQEKKYQLP